MKTSESYIESVKKITHLSPREEGLVRNAYQNALEQKEERMLEFAEWYEEKLGKILVIGTKEAFDYWKTNVEGQ